jgi:hypothetical protein
MGTGATPSSGVAADVDVETASCMGATSTDDAFADGIASTAATSMIELVASSGVVMVAEATATSVALVDEDTSADDGVSSSVTAADGVVRYFGRTITTRTKPPRRHVSLAVSSTPIRANLPS